MRIGTAADLKGEGKEKRATAKFKKKKKRMEMRDRKVEKAERVTGAQEEIIFH